MSLRIVSCALLLASAASAANFGKVVAIGGHAADITLDERRGNLYIANFTANRVDVMSTSDNVIRRSFNVPPQPGSVSLSPNGRYLVVGHYGFAAPPAPHTGGLTVLDLDGDAVQNYSVGNPVLGVAFGGDDLCLVLTTREFLLLDPVSGNLTLLASAGEVLGKTIPQPPGTNPPDFTTASVVAAGDGLTIHGVTSQGSASESLLFIYDVLNKQVSRFGYVSSPTLGPRVMSVNHSGYLTATGWAVTNYATGETYEFPEPNGAFSIGTHVIDSAQGVIYAQIPPPNPPPPPPASATACLPDGRCVTITEAPSTDPTTPAEPPALTVHDLENLAVRERFRLAENLAGRSVLNLAGDVMYAISESGVTVFPVGRNLRNARRVVSSVEDVVFRSNPCERRVTSQEITITDPGGGRTRFSLTSSDPRVGISLSSSFTPARARILVDPTSFQNERGTVAIPLTLASAEGVNLDQTVRVLVNKHDVDQRGSFVSIPGILTDILADETRDRYYVLRQDKNQVLAFDAATHRQIAALKTSSVPTQMAMTTDSKYLLVGHDAAHFVSVFDLDSLQADESVIMPGGNYPRSIAVAGGAILTASRVAGPEHKIGRIDMVSRTGTDFPTLGVYDNKIDQDTVLVASPNGSNIMGVSSDGTLYLYNANSQTFSIARKHTTGLGGAYAASSYGDYVVGNTILNASLIPAGTLGAASGSGVSISTGLAFSERIAYRTSAPAAAGPGLIQKVDLQLGTSLNPTRMLEAPLLSSSAATTEGESASQAVGTPQFVSAFSRTLALLGSRSLVLSLSQSGVTVLPIAYDSAVAPPRINQIVNAADRTRPVAPGGLISVMGANLSPLNMATSQTPMPTALGESCMTVNGIAVPLVFVSPSQVNAQLPFNVDGNSQVTLRTPGGVSDNFNITIQPTAPSVFRARGGVAVVKAANGEVVSAENPARSGDDLVIYTTGLGRTSPAVETGAASPAEPLAYATTQPEVELNGAPAAVSYAGLTPGEVGVYQINIRATGQMTTGTVPLTIRQGSAETTVDVQVAE